MCPIAGTFQGSWHTADLSVALNISHTSTEADGISSDNTFLVALVRERHAVELAITGIKVKGAEIDPGASTHLLVDTELCALALVPYGIESI